MQPAAAPHQIASGIALTILASFGIALLDSVFKTLGGAAPLLLVIWVRYAVHVGLVGIWLRRRAAASKPVAPVKHRQLQVLRGVLQLGVSVLAFLSVQMMPVAEFTAIVMLAPVMATLASPWLLKERVGPMRWLLLAVAFGGALLIVRPGGAVSGPAVLIALVAALVGAASQLLTRYLAPLEDPIRTHSMTGLVGLGVLTLALVPTGALWAPAVPSLTSTHWLLIGLAGLLGTFAQLGFIVASSRAPLPVLMPFTYTQIVFAALLGIVVFSHHPDLVSTAGMALIATAGVISAWFNARPVASSAAAAAVEEHEQMVQLAEGVSVYPALTDAAQSGGEGLLADPAAQQAVALLAAPPPAAEEIDEAIGAEAALLELNVPAPALSLKVETPAAGLSDSLIAVVTPASGFPR